MKTFDKDGKSTTSSAVDAEHYPDPHHAEHSGDERADDRKIADLAHSLWEKRGRPAGGLEQDLAEAKRLLAEAATQKSAIEHVEDSGGSVQA
jgi:hypothetical protein